MTATARGITGLSYVRCRCGRGFFVYKRPADPWCLRCAAVAGSERLGDAKLYRDLRNPAVPRWWQWTCFLAYAINFENVERLFGETP